METTIVYSDFKTLREAYLEVKKFITEETYKETLSLKTTIEGDLGCAGDDNLELLEKFVDTYNVDFEGFDYSKHFLSEGELFGSVSIIVFILSLLFSLIAGLTKIISFHKIDFTNYQSFPNTNQKAMDMTFGDMLTWYLIGKYSLSSKVNFRFKGGL